MSEQDGRQATVIQRPTTNDSEAWKAYWEAKDQPWRTKPEIDPERQKYLDEWIPSSLFQPKSVSSEKPRNFSFSKRQGDQLLKTLFLDPDPSLLLGI